MCLAPTRGAALSLLEAALPPVTPDRQCRLQAFEWGMAVHFKPIADPTGRAPLRQRALDRLDDILIITSAAGMNAPHPQIQFVNDAFERRTGYPHEEAPGNIPRMLQGELTERPVLDTLRAAFSR